MLTEAVFAAPQAREGSLCAVPTMHFHFATELRILSLILTFLVTLEALRLEGHRRSPPFDSPFAMHTYAPPIFRGKLLSGR